MDHPVPACSLCHENLTLPGNKPSSEATVISTLCGHLFHLTCVELVFNNEAVLCRNQNCTQYVERKHLKEVNFETTVSPDASSVANLEAIINGCRLTMRADHTKISQLSTDTRKLEEQITIKASQFETVEKQNLKLVDENEQLQRELQLYKSKLENVEKHESLIVDEIEDLLIKNELSQERSEAESEIRENYHQDCWKYQDSGTRKRTWYKVDRRKCDYSHENYAKRYKRDSSWLQQGSLRPFSLTGRKFGPFSQVVYEGEYAYASGEYLLLGDGVINGVLCTALRADKYFAELMKKSPFYFSRKSIRRLVRNLENLPFLPKKVMISIGDIDSATNDRSLVEVKEALQSLFHTVYHKGVKKIVMIPPVKHNNWHERRYHLDVFLICQAGTKYDWDYYYMQELLTDMSKFTGGYQVRDTYFIRGKDNIKLAEKIYSYTTGNGDEESETYNSS